jgi:hypothetical protein
MLTHLYRYINLLSLDVAAGAACSALFFAQMFQIDVLPIGIFSLGLTVWIIYTCDHLLDARKVKTRASTRRHLFHQVNYKWLVRVMCVAIIADGIIIIFIRRPVFIAGLFLAAAVAVYLVVHRYMPFFKEMFIAVLYTLGVLLPSLTLTEVARQQWPMLVIVQFVLTALVNLLVFSWFDRERDARDGSVSFVTVTGEKGSRACILLLSTTVFLLTPFAEPAGAAYTVAAMNAVLLVIFLIPGFFERNDRFRILGDAVFFMPLVYYLYHA